MTPGRDGSDSDGGAARASADRLARAREALARAESVAAGTAAAGSAGSDSSGGPPGGPQAGSPAGSPAGPGAVPRVDPVAPSHDADADADAEAVARAIVLRQLAMAPRSRAQLADKLRAKDCPEEIAEAVLDRFTQAGLIDDRAYAEVLVRSRRETKGLARRALAHELRRKGVADDIVEDSLEQIEDPDEEEQARRLVDKRLRTLHGLDATVQTRRLAGMLARKGYSSSLSYRIIRDALADAPERRRD